MTYILIFAITLILFFINRYIIQNFNFQFLKINLLDKNFIKPQAFHKKPTLRIGGLLLFINILIIHLIYSFFFNTENSTFLYFLFIFFLIGFLDDLKILENPKLRILFLILSIFLFIQFENIIAPNTGFIFLNHALSEYIIFNYLFLILCFLTIINGSNFIDGFNGLLILHVIIIFFILLIINSNSIHHYNFVILISSLFILLLFNFPLAKIFLGDSGAYSVGYLISYLTITTSNLNNEISPIFFCILLFYLFFEVLFSFTRKVFLKKNPLLPDNKHLHMLIFNIISKKLNLKAEKANYITGATVNLFYLILIFPSLFFYENNFLCKIYFIFCLLLYLFLYYLFFSIDKKLNKIN